MSTSQPSQINVQSADGHVEVTGISVDDVEFAIFLYQELGNERLRARNALAEYVNRTVLSDGINIVPIAAQRQPSEASCCARNLLKTKVLSPIGPSLCYEKPKRARRERGCSELAGSINHSRLNYTEKPRSHTFNLLTPETSTRSSATSLDRCF